MGKKIQRKDLIYLVHLDFHIYFEVCDFVFGRIYKPINIRTKIMKNDILVFANIRLKVDGFSCPFINEMKSETNFYLIVRF